MTRPPPDGSRDRRIEDPSNLVLIHPAARALVRPAIARGVSANMVSITGLVLGAGAALCYAAWREPVFAAFGLALSIGWLIADGLDGMIARATNTASALGRALDGWVDHGVFVMIYVALAASIGTVQGWALAVAAGAAHTLQSSLYEGERTRFHRRRRGIALTAPVHAGGSAAVRFYDRIAGSIDRLALRFEHGFAACADPTGFGERYAAHAVAPMRLLALLSANVRVATIFLACLAGDPRLFWWVEIGPLTLVLIVGLLWHRRVERALQPPGTGPSPAPVFVNEQGRP